MRESHKENVTRLVTMVRKTDADRGGDDGDEENNDVSDSGRAASQSRSKVALYIQIVLIDIMSMYIILLHVEQHVETYNMLKINENIYWNVEFIENVFA